jgi:hypothetical protein
MILIQEIKIIFTSHSQGCQSIEMVFKAFNHLPSYIEELSDDKIQFKNILNNYLLSNYFYSPKNFLMVNFDVNDITGAYQFV